MHRSIMNLDFDRIIEHLKGYACTSLGREAIDEIEILTDRETIEHLLDETEEALRLLYQIGELPFGGITDIRPHVKRAAMGGMLDAHELLAVSHFLYGIRQMKQYIEMAISHQIALGHIKPYIDSLYPLTHLKQAIERAIDEDGTIRDDASDTLRRIRQQIRTIEGRIREQLQSIIQSRRDVLTDAIVTIRNDRFVVPVRADYKNRFPGIVHDQSQSGNTVYIEPQVVVESNNQLNRLFNEEKQEIERILRALSAEVAKVSDTLLSNVEIVKTLDFIYAKAKYARKLDAIRPKVNEKGIIKIYQGRHPLIDSSHVVANDIFLGEKYQAMVITGPNTGGKTVTLKTVGLFTLMMQAGLLIPAKEPTELAIFQNVFSDIGDEQSIEQNLSTFSSHMTNIVHIINSLTDNSLVLFDELGAGTDPKEGAALAIAILDYFLARGARIIATTHYSELKSYAYRKKGVINASVEFDVETLSPTYKLLIGVPGRSNALEISRRLGLHPEILQAAKAEIKTEQDEVAVLIQKLEEQGVYLERLISENEILKKTYEKELEQVRKREQQLKEQRDDLIEKAREEAQRIIREAKAEAEDVIRELRELMKRERLDVKEHEIIALKGRLQTGVYATHETSTTDPSLFKPGQQVKVLTINRMGTLIEKINETEWLVQIGALTSRVDQTQLKLISNDKQPSTSSPKTSGRTSVVKRSMPKVELDLRGKRYEEAMHELDQFLDSAILHNLHQVTIIHGHGTGALRKGVQNYLKRHQQVKSFRFGGEGEGGLGVTIVTLK